MSRALLRRLEAIEFMLAVNHEPIVVRLLSFGPDAREKTITLGGPAPPTLPEAWSRNGSVRMVQITESGEEQIIEVGPAPAGGERAKRRRKTGQATGTRKD